LGEGQGEGSGLSGNKKYSKTPMNRFYYILSILFLCLFLATPAFAQKGGVPRMSFIRDAEVEQAIRQMADPILTAAGLDTESLRIFIVNDKSLNAFVAGGQNLFIHTGLLIRTENAAQLMGVIAHETGHISGGHLARRAEEISSLSEEALLAQLLAAAAVALGGPGPGMAVLSAGAQASQSSILSFTRTQERSADQAGVQFLQRLDITPQGLMDFFKILQQQQKFLVGKLDPYLQTHPLTQERVDAMRQALETTKAKNSDAGEKLDFWHSRMRAKLIGYLQEPEQVLRQYPASDKSMTGRYARSIALYRAGQVQPALDLLNQLIAENPQDPYFVELRGQFEFEQGKIAPSVTDYNKALELAPKEVLIRVGLAQSLLATENKKNISDARVYLEEATRLEPRYSPAWRLLAIAYGKEGKIGLSALALAEQAVALGDKKRAQEQATRAIKLLPSDDVGRVRAQDIIEQGKEK
jgi:predicted Zn-dependent protease